jgi:predicted dehydrogenase
MVTANSGVIMARQPESPAKLRAVISGMGRHALERTVLPLANRRRDLFDVIAFGDSEDGATITPKQVSARFRRYGLEVPVHLKHWQDALNKRFGCKPDVLLVATPNGMHFKSAVEGVGSGLHVYLEKPIATHRDDLPSLLNLARDAGKLLCSGTQRRIEAPYRYLINNVINQTNFGELLTIRCFLAVGDQMPGWRGVDVLAHGGILIDRGFHLLDLAAVLLEESGIQISTGKVQRCWTTHDASIINPEGLDTSAVGHIIFERGVSLIFDLSYHAPQGSVTECIEVRDVMGTLIRIERDQRRRRPIGRRIVHQLASGTVVVPNKRQDKRDAIDWISGADDERPLEEFLEAIRSADFGSWASHPCSGDRSLGMWELLRLIYFNTADS